MASIDIILHRTTKFLSGIGRGLFGLAKIALGGAPAEILCELIELAASKIYGKYKDGELLKSASADDLEAFTDEFLECLNNDIRKSVGMDAKKIYNNKDLSDAILSNFKAITRESVSSYSCLELLEGNDAYSDVKDRLISFMLEYKELLCSQYVKNLDPRDKAAMHAQANATYECFKERLSKDFNFEGVFYEPIESCNHCTGDSFRDFKTYVICESCGKRIYKKINSSFINGIKDALRTLIDEIKTAIGDSERRISERMKENTERILEDTGNILKIVSAPAEKSRKKIIIMQV